MDAPKIPDEFELFENIYKYRSSIQYLERSILTFGFACVMLKLTLGRTRKTVN